MISLLTICISRRYYITLTLIERNFKLKPTYLLNAQSSFYIRIRENKMKKHFCKFFFKHNFLNLKKYAREGSGSIFQRTDPGCASIMDSWQGIKK